MPSQNSRIEHVVVLMLENRSFDHMLGRLPGVNGILGKGGTVNPAFSNPMDPATPGSKTYPAGAPAEFAVLPQDISKGGFGGPGHSFPDATQQLYGTKIATPAQVGKPAPLNGFVAGYLGELRLAGRSQPTDQEINEPMSSFTPDQVPVISALAQQFCVCDQWYSEVPGPTEPNRLFVHAGTAVGLTHNPWEFPIKARTIYEALEAKGKDWMVYFVDINDAIVFPQLKGTGRSDAALRRLRPALRGRHAGRLQLHLSALRRQGRAVRQLAARALRHPLRRQPDRRRLRGAARVSRVGEDAARRDLRRARRVLRPRLAANERRQQPRRSDVTHDLRQAAGDGRSDQEWLPAQAQLRVRLHAPRPARAGPARLARGSRAVSSIPPATSTRRSSRRFAICTVSAR